MGVNKVEYSGETLIDLTNDTVTQENMLAGTTAHNAAGESITGKAVIPPDLSKGGTISGDLEVDGVLQVGSKDTTNFPKCINFGDGERNVNIEEDDDDHLKIYAYGGVRIANYYDYDREDTITIIEIDLDDNINIKSPNGSVNISGKNVNINSVKVPDNPAFTDTVTTATTTGTGNAVTSVTASNGELNVVKGSTFLTKEDISGKANLSGDTFTGNVNFSKGLKTEGIIHLGTDSSYHVVVRTSSPDNIIFSLYNGDTYTEDWFAAINNRDADRLYLSTPRSKFHLDKPLNVISKLSIDDTAYIQRTGTQSIELTAGSDWEKICYDVQDSHWTVRPYTSAALNLGTASYKFDNIYGVTGHISASDKNDKNTINPLTDVQSKDFIMALNPVSYKFNAGSSGRIHYGMISQDVEETLSSLGMSSFDFAGLIKSPKTNQDGTVIEGEYVYGLRYEEFIAPLIKTVQLLQQEIDELKRKIESNSN